MAGRRSRSEQLDRVLEEVRRMRMEAAVREEEIWEAVEELRRWLAPTRSRSVDHPAAPTGEEGENDRMHAEEYRRLKRRLRRFAASVIPTGSRVAVVSRGDDDLLDIPGCRAEHFPRQPGGAYTGYYPKDGVGAIAQFDWVRAAGADYLLFPQTAVWWLEKYPLLASHIESRYRRTEEDQVGVVFDLRSRGPGVGPWPGRIEELLEAWEEEDGEAPALLDWDTGLELAGRLPGRTTFTPPRSESRLPYLDGSVGVVAVTGDDPVVLEEARRVARRTVLHFRHDPAEGASGDSRGRVVRFSVEHRDGPPSPLPSTSVVIPTYNGLTHLETCLRGLEETLPSRFTGEVLVVDDASDSGTARRLERLESTHPWLRVIRNERNAGFIVSCNRGAEAASGDYLVFLNDDTVPLGGWLESLLRTFRLRADAGAVGGRLIYPDGRLQEAGGIIFRDGSGANFGRGDGDVDGPLYAHVRPVHYCSGALLATPRQLFLELGGFDPRYRPAYYEDTDYCFAVRRSGRQVYYQPEANVVHVEGASSGSDAEGGVKRFQSRNRGIFRRKWREELRSHRDPPSSYSPRTWHELAMEGGSS